MQLTLEFEIQFLQKSQLSNSLEENLTFNDHGKNVTTKISKSVGVMRRFHCQLPADVMVLLYYSLVYSHLTSALLAWGRSGLTNAAKIECAHRRARKLLTDYKNRFLTFHSIYDFFALLKAFNTNTLNYHQYFKKRIILSSTISLAQHQTQNK